MSDVFYWKWHPHSQLYGTFPLLLGEISRKRAWLTLAEAVHKITDKPARRFRIAKRGRLQRGYCADVVVFDRISSDCGLPEMVNGTGRCSTLASSGTGSAQTGAGSTPA